MAGNSGGNRVYPTSLSRTYTGLATLGRQFMTDTSNRNKQESKSEDFIKRFIKKVDNSPTDAYGEIEFGSSASHTAKYVKVSHNTSPNVIYQLLKNHWKLKAPNLIISVTGGAKNFSLRARLKEVFRKSLIKASESTGAWIMTGGTHAGVMKHVGKAVKHYAAIKDDEDRVVTIGIAPWGVIYANHQLKNRSTGPQDIPKVYDAEEGSQGGKVVLDHNHSHFILVDDGSDGKYGTEIGLRTNFESHLSTQQTQDGINVMIVSVIVQGGPGSLKTVAGSIENGTPAVIVGGSGGWANVLASAYNLDAKSINVEVVEELLQENYMESNPDRIQEWTEYVKTCVSNKSLMSVFELDPTDSSRDMDIAILEALLKASDQTPGQEHEQLRLAMAWNRSDIARSHILTDDAFIGKKEIAEMFFIALRSNKHKFCRVFLDYGVDLKEYCTVAKLEALYKLAPKDSVVYRKMTKRNDFSLRRVGRILVHLLGHSYITVYKKRRSGSSKYEAINEQVTDRTTKWLSEPWDSMSKVDDPYREIFQWAILVNYREIAMHIWEYMFESMTAAIMATKILKTIAGKMSHDHEKKLQMLADAEEYETLAAGLLDRCFNDNPDKTNPLLIGRLRKWGGYTCLHVATEANDKRFVSRPGVQNLLDTVWMGKLDDNTWTPLLLLSGICPPLIWTAVKFKVDEDDEKDANVVENGSVTEEAEVDDVERGTTSFTKIPSQDDITDSTENTVGFNNPHVDLGGTAKSYNILEKTILFYDAPIVTFWMNVLLFLVYLFLFAYVILSAFKVDAATNGGTIYESVTIYEYVLLGWITTFLFEEFRELFDQEARFMREKIKLHVFDAWNMMDLASLTLFYVGFGLRWFEQFLQISLVLYSIAFMIHCIRIVHIFAVHHILGPKIIMVGKMLKDLLFFLFILIVFLLAYGVASQALLYPGETNVGEIIVGIIYRPYWQIYGELFLDEINYDPNIDEFTCSNAANSNLPRCPQQSTIVPIISAIYLLFANVLLLNLLIAMFSYTFENVERQSNEIWKFQRYNLITDYYFRPPLAPPFIILSHIYRSFAFCGRKISRNMERDDALRHALKMELDAPSRKQLSKWEHWHAEAYVREKHAQDDDRVERQLEKLGNRMDNITSTIEDMQDRLGGQDSSGKGMNKLHSKLDKRFRHLEELIEGLNGKRGGNTAPASTPKPVSEPRVQKAEKKQEESKPKTPQAQRKEISVDLHVKARTSPYPNSNKARFFIPDDKIMWKIEWPAYKPMSYTDPILKTAPAWADDDLESYTDKDRPRLPYNKYDQVNKVNRRSHLGTYLVVNGIPLNPRGRTGLTGRGLLGRYGPNHAADPVVTRWKRDANKEIIKINGKPVLEFAAVKRSDTGEWAIPGGMVDPGEHVSATLKREFSEEALNIDGVDDPIEIEKIKENVQLLFKSGGLELFKGYCDDHRNTDNAWIETTACNFHDEDGTAFVYINLSPGEEANKASWKQVDHNLKLFASHYEILKKAAEVHNAYF